MARSMVQLVDGAEPQGYTNLLLLDGDPCDIPLLDGRCSTVFSARLTSVPDPIAVLIEWDRVVKPGGLIILDIAQGSPPFSTIPRIEQEWRSVSETARSWSFDVETVKALVQEWMPHWALITEAFKADRFGLAYRV